MEVRSWRSTEIAPLPFHLGACLVRLSKCRLHHLGPSVGGGVSPAEDGPVKVWFTRSLPAPAEGGSPGSTDACRDAKLIDQTMPVRHPTVTERTNG